MLHGEVNLHLNADTEMKAKIGNIYQGIALHDPKAYERAFLYMDRAGLESLIRACSDLLEQMQQRKLEKAS